MSRPTRHARPPSHASVDDKEEEGLLSGAATPRTKELEDDTSNDRHALSPRSVLRVALVCITLLLLGLGAGRAATSYYGVKFAGDFPDEAIISNGTHAFKKTVLMVSLDGFRTSYLDRDLTPNLLNISRVGLRAEYMKPAFPTLTFPNHWSLLTGLYPETHGIVANDFWDPKTGKEFVYTDPERSWDSTWWGGEPIWATAGKAGLTTANLMWPGPPVHHSGLSPTYFIPWRDHVPLKEKVDQIFTWLDYPIESRPQLITAYSPDIDQMGHLGGPDSAEVNKTLRDVDEFARDLHAGLRQRNLTDVVSVIFVSDHGMWSTSNIRLIYLDDILGAELVNQIEHEEGWPNVGLRFSPSTNTSDVLSVLQDAAAASNHAFHVYTHETMPQRFHFSNNERIAPIYMLPHLGWAITNHHEHEVVMHGDYEPKGNHGYDNDEPAMHAIFVADGPFAHMVKRAHARKNRRFLSSLFGEQKRGEPHVMPGFDNVELYSLVCRLLGIQGVQTNGTEAYWDQYF